MTDARTPWTAAQARVVVACDVVAGLLILVCGMAAGGKHSLRQQIVWIDLALVALLIAIVINGFLFLFARRAIGQRLRDLLS